MMRFIAVAAIRQALETRLRFDPDWVCGAFLLERLGAGAPTRNDDAGFYDVRPTTRRRLIR